MPYQKGNPGGPGRPPKAVEDAQRSVLLELFNEQAERDIVTNMITNAKRKGVVAASSAINAATWLWDRKYGKVKDQLEIGGPNGGLIGVSFVNYRSGIAGAASGSADDSDAPGED